MFLTSSNFVFIYSHLKTADGRQGYRGSICVRSHSYPLPSTTQDGGRIPLIQPYKISHIRLHVSILFLLNCHLCLSEQSRQFDSLSEYPLEFGVYSFSCMYNMITVRRVMSHLSRLPLEALRQLRRR